MIGEYTTYSVAKLALAQVKAAGYKDAFITAWIDGKRLSTQELMQLIKSEQQGKPAPFQKPAPKPVEEEPEPEPDPEPVAAVDPQPEPNPVPVTQPDPEPEPEPDPQPAKTSVDPPGDGDDLPPEDPAQDEFGDDLTSDTDPVEEEEEVEGFDMTLLPDLKYTGEARSGYVFRIHIGSYKGTMKDRFFDKLKDFKPYVVHIVENNMNVYYVGDYSDVYAANRALEEIFTYGFGSAYIDGWKGGQKLSYGELRDLLTK